MAFTQLYKGKVSSESPYPCVYLAYEHQRSGANMQYRFKYKLYLYNTTSSSVYYNNIRFRIYLNGSKVLEINHKSSKAGSDWSTGEKTTSWYTVSNKTSGTTPCYFTAVDTNNSSWTNKTSSTWNLTVDPAYFTSTPTISLKSKTETQIIMNWSTSQACSAITAVSGKAAIASWTGSGGTSGTITYNTNANTTLQIQCTFKRKDSGLTTNCAATSQTTYDWPKPTGANNFIIGGGALIPVSNPCGRTYKLQLFQKDPDPNDSLNGLIAEYNGSYNGTVGAELKGDGTYVDSGGTHNINWDDRQYETIPSKYKDYYYCKVTYGDHVKTYDNNNTYEVNPTNCAPIFNSSAITDIVDVSNNAGNISNYNYGGQNRSPKIITGHNTIQLIINEAMIGVKYAEVSGGKYVISTNSDTNIKEILYSDISNYPYTVTLDNNLKGNVLLITAYDSRGVPTAFTKTLDYVNYNSPYGNAEVVRNNGVGTEAKINISGRGTNWTSQMEKIPGTNNSKAKSNIIPVNGIKYKYKEQGISQWSSEWISTNNQEIEIAVNNTWSINNLLIAPDGGFNNTKSYDIKFKIEDLLESYETEVYTITTAQAYIWKDLENLYVGIKKKPECELDVNGDLNIDGKLTAENFYPVGSTYITDTNTNPNTILGFGEWELYDKEFAKCAEKVSDTVPGCYTLNNASATQIWASRAGHHLHIEHHTTTNVVLNDTSYNLITLDLTKLGVYRLNHTFYHFGNTDGGNGIAQCRFSTVGVFVSDDVVTKAANGTIPSGAVVCANVDSIIGPDNMIDSFCDKFYWRRVEPQE